MPPSDLAHVLRSYATDLDACGAPYATMAATLREAADLIEGQCLTEDEVLARAGKCVDCDD